MAPTKKAVVCDDDRTFVHIMQFVLSKKGFSADTAGNGVEALKLIASVKPGLLFLDLEMPEKDGFAVLGEMRESKLDKPYTIVLSSHESQEVRGKAAGLGADEVWVKPFNAAELMERVEELIKRGKI